MMGWMRTRTSTGDRKRPSGREAGDETVPKVQYCTVTCTWYSSGLLIVYLLYNYTIQYLELL